MKIQFINNIVVIINLVYKSRRRVYERGPLEFLPEIGSLHCFTRWLFLSLSLSILKFYVLTSLSLCCILLYPLLIYTPQNHHLNIAAIHSFHCIILGSSSTSSSSSFFCCCKWRMHLDYSLLRFRM